VLNYCSWWLVDNYLIIYIIPVFQELGMISLTKYTKIECAAAVLDNVAHKKLQHPVFVLMKGVLDYKKIRYKKYSLI
jgi:hypothetical protein